MARESAEPKARILIVEDEFLIALELKDEAERLGYQVTGTAATGERALALAEETRPNLVLMDILLKGEMDGIEAAEAIRDRWGIPVIFLTAYAEADRLKSARLVYPFGYLIKPVKERDLEITIEMALYLVQADAVRKEAEKALRQSEVRYRQIFNNMSNGVAIYRAVDDGEDFVFIDINPAGARSGNMPRQDHIGRSVRQVYPGVRDLGLFDVFQRVHRTGLDEFHPLSLYQDDAITLWVENYVCRLPSGDIMAVYSDLTESKRAESALRSSEERYRHLFENAPVGLFQSRLSDGKIMACNSFFARQTGYDTPEACCDDYVAAEHCVDPAARDRVVSELVRQGKVIDREIEVTRKDGTPVWTRFSAKVYPEEGLVVGAVIDITESKRAAEALVESEEKFRVISEQSLLGMAIVQDEVVRYANQAYAAISEYSVEEILSWKPGESAKTIHPDDRDFVLAQALKKQQGEPGAVTNYVYRGVTRSGKVKWIEIFSRTILFNHRPADLMTFIDISERKQAEEALRDSQEKYRLLIETAADAIFIAQKDVIKFPNAKALELTGYTEAELASIPFTEIIHPDDRDLVLARHRSRLRGDSPPPTYEFRIRHKTGHVVPVQLNTAVTQWEGQPATLNVVRDVTEQKRLEQQLQQAHKMEAIGTLAGGIAHDF
ncbi:MAG: PAS domain S-box protein, partial [Proteobacteria bacterium]|nr:PAS domain S-box protein [Pseudomonadota bacterium]